MIQRPHGPTLCLALGLAALVGCGGVGEGEGGVCQQAAAHVERCLGSAAAAGFAQCSEWGAQQVLATRCEALPKLLGDGKFDLGLDAAAREQVRQAVRDALRQALVTALESAAKAVGDALGSLVSQRKYYVLLHTAKTESAAHDKADAIRRVLGAGSSIQPIVAERDGVFDVLHARCPLAQLSDLAATLAPILVDHPELITTLGGRFSRGPQSMDDDGRVQQSMSIQLPFAVLPVTDATAKALGCSR